LSQENGEDHECTMASMARCLMEDVKVCYSVTCCLCAYCNLQQQLLASTLSQQQLLASTSQCLACPRNKDSCPMRATPRPVTAQRRTLAEPNNSNTRSVEHPFLCERPCHSVAVATRTTHAAGSALSACHA
jgi:hypothetical protein